LEVTGFDVSPFLCVKKLTARLFFDAASPHADGFCLNSLHFILRNLGTWVAQRFVGRIP